MRKGRFSEEQMVAIIREADRDPVAAVAKRHGISEQTIYTWRKRFGGLQASDVKRLRQLEVENGRLKKLVAERDLEIEVMKEVAARHRHGIDRTRQALADWRRESFNGKFRDECRASNGFVARRGEGSDRRMAATLQRGTSAFEPRLSHAERVRGSRNKASAPPCNGPGRYGIWGLRAPARC